MPEEPSCIGKTKHSRLPAIEKNLGVAPLSVIQVIPCSKYARAEGTHQDGIRCFPLPDKLNEQSGSCSFWPRQGVAL